MLPPPVVSRRPQRSALITSCLLILLAGACTTPAHQGRPRLGTWTPLPAGPPPRLGHSSVWTGNEMLVWGGQQVRGASFRADGEAFDPSSERWSPIPVAPLEPRLGQVAAWTGSRLLVWGGDIQGEKIETRSFADGASFDPATGQWTRLAASPLEPRGLHSAVWTGSRLLIWGGTKLGGTGKAGEEEEGGELLSDGAAYDPVADQWTPMAKAPLEGRAGHVAVWTGRNMIVWGGAAPQESGVAFVDGAAYDPVTNAWTSIGVAPVQPGGRYTAVWTGREMLVWGGSLAQGAAYDPATNRWIPLPRSPLPFIPTPTSVWTGRVMLIWGTPEGTQEAGQEAAEGAAYDPARGKWITLASAPSAPGDGQTAIWTGRQMLLWGGFEGSGRFATGGAFSPGGPSP